MSKVRVFELAKELGLSSKELMARLQEFGFAISSHMSTLEEKECKLVMKKLGHLRRTKKVVAKKAKPAKKKAPKEKAIVKPEAGKEKKKKAAKKKVKSEPAPAATATTVLEPPEVEEPKVIVKAERLVEEQTPPTTTVDEVVEKPPIEIEEKADETDFADETDLLMEEKKRVELRVRRRDRRKRKREREKERLKKLEEAKQVTPPPPPSERLLRRKARGPRRPVITVDEVMTVDELAKNLKMKASALILELMQMNIMATKNQPLELDIVGEIAEQHGFDVTVATSPEDLLDEEEVEESPQNLQPRAPVVTVMGHVDHGKTALLDVIRKTNVIAEEAGGITQHIGAYDVKLAKGHVVFLDTPGHEAFTAMRAHGAGVTDVVVLVVAADDGVMPQTMEAINHARAADVPIVAAINKIDKPEADIERVKRQLADLDLIAEDWGGKTIVVPVSAKTAEGIDNLLEMLLLEADLLELKANPNRPVRGIVLEAKLDRGRGAVATVLIQSGTLRVGDAFIAGTQYGRVRAMLNDRGDSIGEAGPATPVEVLGFTGVPQASDVFISVADEKKARQIADSRALKHRQKEMIQRKRITLEDLYERIKAGEIKELNVIIKGDVQGSVTALQDSLLKLSTGTVKLNVIHTGVGGISESDVILASASNALLLGFNVRPDANASALAEREGVDYRLYRVIYDVVDDVRAAMEGLLEPEKKEVFLGRAEVLQVFKVSSYGTIAGSRVTEGDIASGQRMRLVRDGVIVYDGGIASLKRHKDFVRTAPAGTECGIGLENFNDIKMGDVLECYRIEEIARTL
jgi:translation initiation factor IF-2